MSRQELIFCYQNNAACGEQSFSPFEEELTRRMRKLPTATLVRCLADWKVCGVFNADIEGWPISEELARRGPPGSLLAQFGHEKNVDVRDGLEHLAYQFHNDADAGAYMRFVFVNRLDDGENLYWPAMYLAKKCDVAALRHLNPGIKSKSIADNFSVSSLMFSDTVTLFGNCHYRPAIPYMVAIGLHAASLNLVDAAQESLHKFYLSAPKFDTMSSMQHWYCNAAHRDGFRFNCNNDDAPD